MDRGRTVPRTRGVVQAREAPRRSPDVTARLPAPTRNARSRACATRSEISSERAGSVRRPRSICAISGSIASYVRCSRRCATKSRASRSPYRSPSKSSAYASTRRSRPENVGLVPIDTAASQRLVLPPADQPGRVHPVGGHRRVPVAEQVGGGEAQLTPALVAPDHHALQPVRAAQRRPPRRATSPASTQDRMYVEEKTVPSSATSGAALHPEAERPPEPLQQRHVAGRPVPEPEVVPHHHQRRVQVLDQDVVHERLGRQPGELRR